MLKNEALLRVTCFIWWIGNLRYFRVCGSCWNHHHHCHLIVACPWCCGWGSTLIMLLFFNSIACSKMRHYCEWPVLSCFIRQLIIIEIIEVEDWVFYFCVILTLLNGQKWTHDSFCLSEVTFCSGIFSNLSPFGSNHATSAACSIIRSRQLLLAPVVSKAWERWVSMIQDDQK